MVASSVAFAIAVTINTHMGGGLVHFEVPYFWQMLVIDGIIGGVLALVIGAFVKLKMQVQQTQSELSLKAIETARAQALALQSQINPHFFFNTLNSISALVDDDPDAAKQMIGRLADMFRYTLGCTHTEAVGLDQELQFVRDYLAIEQARFRRRLRVELPAGLMSDIRVPGLILQPLVENAVKHGIARSIEGGTISIEVERTDGGTRISVRNTSEHASEPASLYRTGHALENIRARLRLFTGLEDPLHIVWNAEFTEFSFVI
jgi:two-component system LytT family sensor kinase